MPNQPKTQNRSIRIPDDVWAATTRCADMDGVTNSTVVLDAVRQYLARRGLLERATR